MWEKIANQNLGIKAKERLVILADEPVDVPLDAEVIIVPSDRSHGQEPAREVWESVFGAAALGPLELDGVLDRIIDKNVTDDDEKAISIWQSKIGDVIPNAVIAITYFSTSHTAFRRILAGAGCRYASMPLFDMELLREGGPLDVDQSAMAKRTQNMAAQLNGASDVHITTPIGTDFRFSVKGRDFHADDGDLTQKGSFGNLPAGEAYCAPVEGTGEGRLVIQEGFALIVEKGQVVSLEGEAKDDSAQEEKDLARIFQENRDWLQLAELGIGTNENASRIDNLLEEEKIMGTVHIAFGDNSGFGGKQKIPYHRDHVLWEPTLIVDGTNVTLPQKGTT